MYTYHSMKITQILRMKAFLGPPDPLLGGDGLCGRAGAQLSVLLPAAQMERLRGLLWRDFDSPSGLATGWHVYRDVWVYCAV